MRSGATLENASSSTIESSPPDTASSSGAAGPCAARLAHSRTSCPTEGGIAHKYTACSSHHGIGASGSASGATVSLLRRNSITRIRSDTLETHGPLGTLWVGLGLCAFYIALVWINTLLGFVLTPLFGIPLTWLQDKVMGKTRVRD